MTRALSQDLRDRVIAVVDGGMSCNRAAERFGIAISSAVRWVRAWRTEGRAEALPRGGDLRSHRIERYRDVKPALSTWFSRVHREYEAGNLTRAFRDVLLAPRAPRRPPRTLP